jgi:hypothetical protein
MREETIYLPDPRVTFGPPEITDLGVEYAIYRDRVRSGTILRTRDEDGRRRYQIYLCGENAVDEFGTLALAKQEVRHWHHDMCERADGRWVARIEARAAEQADDDVAGGASLWRWKVRSADDPTWRTEEQ